MPWGVTRFHHSGQSHFVIFCCYHRRRLFATDAGRQTFESGSERVRRSFRLQVYGYVVMLEHVHLLLSEPQQGTAPLKPKPGLSGPPVRVGHAASRLPSIIGIHMFGRRRGAIQTLKLPAFIGGLRRREGHLFFDGLPVLSSQFLVPGIQHAIQPGPGCRALLGWADEGVRPYVGCAGLCVEFSRASRPRPHGHGMSLSFPGMCLFA